MSETGDMRTLLQYCIFLLLLVVGVTPFVMMLARSATFQAQMRSLGCSLSCLSSCFTCSFSSCFSRQSVHYDEHDLRTLQELEEPQRPVGITGAYRMYQARRARMALRLASWHEDVKKCGRQDDLHYKLQKLHAQQLQYESRSNDAAASASAAATAAPAGYSYSNYPGSSASSSNSGGVPFDIQIVEINDRVNEDTSSERSFGTAYAAMPDTPTASDRSNVIELRSQDEEEEKEEAPATSSASHSAAAVDADSVHAIV